MVGSFAVACALLVGGTPGAAAAPTPAAPSDAAGLRWIATLGYDVPVGEAVALQASSATGPTTLDVHLNGGFVVQVGAGWAPWSGSAVELRATIGVKDDAAVSSDAHATYRAFPLELLAAWGGRSVRVAAGLSLALGASVRGEDVVSAVGTDLKPSAGLVGQIEWVQRLPGSRLGSSFGARVLWQTLEAESGATVAASALGLFVGLSY